MALRRRGFELCLVAGGCALAVLIVWSNTGSGDYWPGGQVLGDSNAAPGIEALAHGHLAAYAANQPLMGLVSLVLRVPAVLVAQAFPGHHLLEYQLGAVLCLLSAPVLVVWLSRLGSGRQWKAVCLLLLVVVVAGPFKIDAVRAGHPEEVMTAVLAAAAVIAAERQRPGWAGSILGLAVGTKPWAVLAALPVLLALSRDRWKAASAAVVVGGIAMLGALADPSIFLARARGLGSMHLVNPYSLWWQVGHDVPGALVPARMLPLGITRSTGLVFATGSMAAVAVSWGLRRRTSRLTQPLALLAVLWLVRAVADPHPNDYYYVPFLIGVAVWETYSLRRLPLLAVLGAALLMVTYRLPFFQPAWPNTFLLVWTATIGIYLVRRAFGRQSGRPAFVHLRGRNFNVRGGPVDLKVEDA